ncbi:MAG: DUF6542 domain-containing protein [Frankia sp.]
MRSPQYRDSAEPSDWSDRSGAGNPRRQTQRERAAPPPTVVAGSGRGLTVLGAALIALIAGFIGAILDSVIFGQLGVFFGICFAIGCLIAVGRVHDDDLLAVVVMPPLIYAVITILFGLFHPSGGGDTAGLKNKVINVGSELILRAPVLIIAMVVVIIVATVRGRRVRAARQERERALAAAGSRGSSRGRRPTA